MLIDTPDPGGPCRQQVFITAAVTFPNKEGEKGKILGVIIFGQRSDSFGNWNKDLLLPPKFYDGAPEDFFSAVKVWNSAPGKQKLPELEGSKGPEKTPY
jgi:hypothetical protein